MYRFKRKMPLINNIEPRDNIIIIREFNGFSINLIKMTQRYSWNITVSVDFTEK